MATFGVPPVQIGVKRSIGIRRSPLLIDGLTPPTMQTAHSLYALVWILVKEANTLVRNIRLLYSSDEALVHNFFLPSKIQSVAYIVHVTHDRGIKYAGISLRHLHTGVSKHL